MADREKAVAVEDVIDGGWYAVPPEGGSPLAGPFPTEEGVLDWIEDWEDLL